jgi:hypothetical protein
MRTANLLARIPERSFTRAALRTTNDEGFSTQALRRMCLGNDHAAVGPVAVTAGARCCSRGLKIEGTEMSGGAGGKDSCYWYTKGLGAVMINNPNYGKMAADSIAQEVAEPKLDVHRRKRQR